ncbi:hypothetical protein ACL9RL_11555 [Plantibacter sp. Mn2098]|uniref:hypothetical protein n=1 Tax=Plantibacter sp. Mn2098 TaxID=3395266 RepID=UPI003BBCA69B
MTGLVLTRRAAIVRARIVRGPTAHAATSRGMTGRVPTRPAAIVPVRIVRAPTALGVIGHGRTARGRIVRRGSGRTVRADRAVGVTARAPMVPVVTVGPRIAAAIRAAPARLIVVHAMTVADVRSVATHLVLERDVGRMVRRRSCGPVTAPPLAAIATHSAAKRS